MVVTTAAHCHRAPIFRSGLEFIETDSGEVIPLSEIIPTASVSDTTELYFRPEHLRFPYTFLYYEKCYFSNFFFSESDLG